MDCGTSTASESMSRIYRAFTAVKVTTPTGAADTNPAPKGLRAVMGVDIGRSTRRFANDAFAAVTALHSVTALAFGLWQSKRTHDRIAILVRATLRPEQLLRGKSVETARYRVISRGFA